MKNKFKHIYKYFFISFGFGRYVSEIIIILFTSVAMFSFYGCEKNLDLSQFPITNNGGVVVSDTSYVQQYPVWTGFNSPEDVCVGKDAIIYVADTYNNRIVQMDLSGAIIGTLDISGTNVNRPHKITQDNNFDLLILADSAISSQDTVSILYRIKLVEVGGIISNAKKLKLISSQSGTILTSNKRKFTGVSIFPDNSYIVTRVGPSNSGVDPDNAIIKMKGKDSVTYLSVLEGFQVSGNGVFSIEKTSSINVVRNSSTDFVITRSTSDYGFKIEWFVYNYVNGSYDAKFLPESQADVIMKQFGSPTSTAMDQNNSLFVIDSGLDSLYKYSVNGIKMPRAFGGKTAAENSLNAPRGISFFNKVLYIADAGNNRIVRYKLSTDLN